MIFSISYFTNAIYSFAVAISHFAVTVAHTAAAVPHSAVAVTGVRSPRFSHVSLFNSNEGPTEARDLEAATQTGPPRAFSPIFACYPF